jgi:membrane associated rhomboid family serine protease
MSHNQATPRETSAPGSRRRNRGWRFVVVTFGSGIACAFAALILNDEPRAVLAGLALLLAAVAVYCAFDTLILTRSFDPIEPGEGPVHTALPRSPVTLVHDPGAPPNTSLERTREA